jgi:hypothetical protein
LCTYFLCSPACLAAVETPTAFDFSGIERRFFRHDNQRLTPAERLERIEQFVFGQSLKGNADQRVSRIQAVISRQQKEGEMTRRRLTATETGQPNRPGNAPRTTEANEVPARREAKPQGPQAETTDEDRARVHGWEHYRPEAASLPARPNRSCVIQSGLTAKPEPSMMQELSYLEQQVFGTQFGQNALVERIHRLENQLYPSIVIAPTEVLTLRIGRLFDRMEDMRTSDPQSLPVKNVRPFDEVTFLREAEDRYKQATEKQSADDNSVQEILRAERELAQFAEQIDDNGFATRARPAGKHGFRHAFVSTLVNIAAITLGAY